jgi:hypothetical protein
MRAFLGPTVVIMLVGLGLSACVGQPAAAPSSRVASPTSGASSVPTPSSTPTRIAPALGSLVIGPDGMGDLEIGVAVPATSLLVHWNPTACTDGGGAEAGQPFAGQWQASYPDDPNGPFQHDPFRIATAGGVQGGVVVAIGPNSPQVSTDRGIHLLSDHSAMFAAYPDVAVSYFPMSDVYSIPGTSGHRLDIELLHPGIDPDLGGKVVAITAVDGSAAPRPIYGSDTGLGCSV